MREMLPLASLYPTTPLARYHCARAKWRPPHPIAALLRYKMAAPTRGAVSHNAPRPPPSPSRPHPGVPRGTVDCRPLSALRSAVAMVSPPPPAPPFPLRAALIAAQRPPISSQCTPLSPPPHSPIVTHCPRFPSRPGLPSPFLLLSPPTSFAALRNSSPCLPVQLHPLPSPSYSPPSPPIAPHRVPPPFQCSSLKSRRLPVRFGGPSSALPSIPHSSPPSLPARPTEGPPSGRRPPPPTGGETPPLSRQHGRPAGEGTGDPLPPFTALETHFRPSPTPFPLPLALFRPCLTPFLSTSLPPFPDASSATALRSLPPLPYAISGAPLRSLPLFS